MENQEKLTLLIEESIKLELNVADLYFLFHDIFPEDSDFWWQLTLEEKNHAALMRSGKEKFVPHGIFPEDLVMGNLEKLKEMNSQVESLLGNFKERSPSRQEAFDTAFHLENSAGELHYQNFITQTTNSNLDRIFQELNEDDKDHALRIKDYMKENSID